MSAFSILVADDLGTEGVDLLREAGEVTIKTGMDEDALRETLPGFDALIVRSATKVTARALEGADRLAVIGRAGIGVDNIDLDAATERGIVVMNTPDAGATTTAEHAISLLVSMARKVPAADAALKAGRWDKKLFTGVELTGKVFGVVGLGNIGRIVAERGKGLAMEVIAHDPYMSPDRAPTGVQLVDLDELCARADFVSIHVPLMDATRGLFDRDRLSKLKQGARLVHAARGGIVDDDALGDLLESGHIAEAALDVFEVEPLPEDHRFRKLPNVVLTPHIGASTAEAKRNVALDLARQMVTCLQRGVALNGVNVPRIAPGDAIAVSPFLSLANNLGSFLGQLRPGRVESIRVTLQGELTAGAAKSLAHAAMVGVLKRAVEGPVTPVNVEQIAESLDIRTHIEQSQVKRDFVNLVRVEALIEGRRHFVSGTVLGSRHGRLVEFDGYFLDAIPEPPLLATFHRDQPGVLGAIGGELGRLGINVERMQLADPLEDGGEAFGVWNLERALADEDLRKLEELAPVDRVLQVR